jgi:hypothetical protein
LVGIIAGIVATAAIACDPGAGVTWVNQTDQSVVIYLSDRLDADLGTDLPPRSNKTEAVIKDVWRNLVVVRDEQGNVLFRQTLTWDQLKAQGFRFVITEEMLSPSSPTPAPSPGTTPTPSPVTAPAG